MMIKTFEYRFSYTIIFLLLLFSCNAHSYQTQNVKPGAEQLDSYSHLLLNKRIALVVNQTSMVGNTHLLDTLLSLKHKVSIVFAPEHGFRGNYEAGASVQNEFDKKTGVRIISLYGKHKKPTPSDLSGIDLVIYDIQDVGARFYTYISTLHYVMEACAEQQKPLLILDRPNPNGFYVDGPVLDTAFASFVGMHPVPVVHGLTIGEYARMINGEKWLHKGVQCDITIIQVKGYNKSTRYQVPVFPSPNLQRMSAIYLYPTTCFFEGTSYSLGRGTSIPFECAGKPGLEKGTFEFKPVPIKGVADNPPHAHKVCRGYVYTNLVNDSFFSAPGIWLSILIEAYNNDTQKQTFFTPFFDKLAGTDMLRKQIESGKSASEIKQSWQTKLTLYQQMSSKYKLYPYK